jgi:hypothetical protein
MHDPAPVRRIQRIEYLFRVFDCFIERQRTSKRLAVDVLHNEVVGSDIMERADVRMIQGGNGARLTLKALAELGRRNLDGDGAPEPCVTRLPYLAHASCADGRQDFIRSEASSGRARHHRRSSEQFTVSRVAMAQIAKITGYEKRCGGFGFSDYVLRSSRRIVANYCGPLHGRHDRQQARSGERWLRARSFRRRSGCRGACDKEDRADPGGADLQYPESGHHFGDLGSLSN